VPVQSIPLSLIEETSSDLLFASLLLADEAAGKVLISK